MANSRSSDNLFAGALKDKIDQSADDVSEVETAEEVQADAGSETETKVEEPKMTELDVLKNRARMMGINFSNNIGVDGLKAKISAKLEGEKAEPEQAEEEAEEAAAPKVTKHQAAMTARQKMIKEQMKLVRVRITNLDPKKRDLPGEVFTFANGVIGAVRKYIPYGEATDNGYHIPQCIYTQLKEREFLNIKTRKDSRGRIIVETGMAREFALEVLPQLNEKELARLAASQAAAAGQD